MKEVAAAASVSVGTVSNVLNAPEKVAPATVERVLAAIDRLGFVRNDAARQLKAGRSRCVGLVVLDIGNPFFSDVARAAQQRAADHDLVVLLGSSDDEPDRERRYIETFDEQRVYGLLISPAGERIDRLVALHDRGVPVVLVDRDGHGTPFSSVAVDDVAGGDLAVRHLCAVGRRRIAVVGGPATLAQVADRRAGARRAARAHPGVRLTVLDTHAPTVLAGRAAGEHLVALPADERPDAVFCVNDLLAIGVLQALTLHGVTVPDDIALVGYDDIDFAESAIVPLTSVRQPRARIGSSAIDLLVSVADGKRREPEHVCFRPDLVQRASSR
ncbi:LacI family DNA-binding transcriptional regulator [Nocardia farcinica]|uniref:LacI family DNA-binding transcriptional regulator n=1 Tax=Nocardia farcinica TaxID=37329 RepID=UPI0018938380|nr:LacI family DNA-binding transcriptional regulator [Nocardia farcinica]MBF6183654.1 LacI family DNA-binding transcriptional regulator [Nocardia farcinica]MBF6309497.1 LacI family DNA-binding transcriptional regulator [Nocardia farcinica]MBF6406681.1 LacI family DNA-binding transcriptional regulator [Nocardia farcinica]UEX25809.1 LacI family transcriptional regulator [Nocardia farcinica]